MSDVLRRIASLASSLTQAELRVLLELAMRAEASGAMETSASSRDLAEATGLARANVQGAIDSLNARRLLQSDAGSPTQPAVHRLVFLQNEINGSGLAIQPQVAQLLSHPGLVSEPPGDEKSVIHAERIEERASVRVDSIDFDKTIDRLQKPKKGDFEESIFEVARMKIASHHAKYAREENRLPTLPDDAITAQFLAVAEWPRLEALLYDLAAERKEAGYSYGWYVTVALQRIHGLSPARVREMRARLKVSPKAKTNVTTVPRPTPFRGSDAFRRKPSGREQSTGSEQRADIEQLKHKSAPPPQRDPCDDYRD